MLLRVNLREQNEHEPNCRDVELRREIIAAGPRETLFVPVCVGGSPTELDENTLRQT